MFKCRKTDHWQKFDGTKFQIAKLEIPSAHRTCPTPGHGPVIAAATGQSGCSPGLSIIERRHGLPCPDSHTTIKLRHRSAWTVLSWPNTGRCIFTGNGYHAARSAADYPARSSDSATSRCDRFSARRSPGIALACWSSQPSARAAVAHRLIGALILLAVSLRRRHHEQTALNHCGAVHPAFQSRTGQPFTRCNIKLGHRFTPGCTVWPFTRHPHWCWPLSAARPGPSPAFPFSITAHYSHTGPITFVHPAPP